MAVVFDREAIVQFAISERQYRIRPQGEFLEGESGSLILRISPFRVAVRVWNTMPSLSAWVVAARV